jgi:gliding motility-associated-like protein
VTDDQGCQSVACFTIAGGHLDVTASTQDAGGCESATGSATLTVNGGAGPHTFTWSTGDVTAVPFLNNLVPGVYSVTVTQQGNPDCQGVAVFAIGVTNGSNFTITSTSTDVTCAGDGDGSIDITVTGGAAPYTILWADGPTTEDRNGLQAGVYVVQITDNEGCSTFHAATVTEPEPMVATVITEGACEGEPTGSIKVTVTGGRNPVIDWSPSVPVNGLLPLGSVWSFTITDDGGCQISGADTIAKGPDCGEEDVLIPQVLTPDGNGLMDEWNILNIEEYPNNQVKIFNRWGDLVYEAEGYANDWYGTYMDTGRPLPDGTYYWIVWLNDDEDRQFQGFLVIHRNPGN